LLKEWFHVRFNDLNKLPLYKDFVKSPQYQEWLQDQKDETTGKNDNDK
jgi:hypothetical protein